MQALYVSDGQLSFRSDIPQPIPQLDEALIRITCAGICSTDLEIVKGYAGFTGILGHEFVGVVEQAPDKEWIGKRVVGTINLACRQCAVCHKYGAEHCPQRTVLGIINKDGIFAQYATLPLTNLLEVPDRLTDEEAVFTEPLAAALRIRQQLPISPTARVAVVGPGRLGLLIAQVLALAGTPVTVLGRRPETLTLPQSWGLETGLVTAYPNDAFDFVVEATGNEEGFAHSLRLVRPLGTLVLKSTFAGNANLDLTKLVVDEITVVGSRCGPFAPALHLLAQHAVYIRDLMDGSYPLEEGIKAFEHAAKPGTRKILLYPNHES